MIIDINHIISEWSKQAQKAYKTRHNWVGKVIHWELCKKFTFDHTNKWYMHNPAPLLENDIHKLLWDFKIQTDHLISARRPDQIIMNKKLITCRIVDFADPPDHRVKLKENEKKDKYLDLARELKKLWNIKVTVISVVIGALGKLGTVVEADQKAPFSIATIPRCRGGCYSFPKIAPLYPWYLPYIAES